MCPSPDAQARERVLRDCGAAGSVLDELLDYDASARFPPPPPTSSCPWPRSRTCPSGRSTRRARRSEVADFVALRVVDGRYRPDRAALFLGLESFPDYRVGGRLENYRGSLSDDAFVVLRRVAHAAIGNLARFDAGFAEHAGSAEIARMLVAMTRLSLVSLAQPGAPERLQELVAAA